VPLRDLPYGRQIDKRVAIAIHEVFQQPRYFRLGSGIFDIINQPGQREDLPLADKLLGQVGFENCISCARNASFPSAARARCQLAFLD